MAATPHREIGGNAAQREWRLRRTERVAATPHRESGGYAAQREWRYAAQREWRLRRTERVAATPHSQSDARGRLITPHSEKKICVFKKNQ